MNEDETLEAAIDVRGASLDIPIVGMGSRSLKKAFLNLGSAGRIAQGAANEIVHIEALSGVDLVARTGDRVAVLGQNGSGKSTLLRLLASIYEPTSGEVSVVGRTVPLLDIGFGIDDEATGRENIRIRGMLQLEDV